MPGSGDPSGRDDRKAALRAELRAVRRAITADADQRAVRSARIWDGVVAVAQLAGDHMGVRRILLFESLPSEPDTSQWIEWCHGHELDVFLPEVDGLDLRLRPGDADPATLDVAVVPGLGFAADGRRLGQGGGHFDRFLPRLRAECLTIGVCFAEQLLDDLPTERHDVRVRAVVTDAAAPTAR